MHLESIGEIIATRRLSLVDDPATQILVQMGKPQPYPENGSYYCPFQIVGIGDGKVRYGAGVDEFQAIELCLQIIGVYLWVWNGDHNGRLRWECDEKLLGFPMPDISPDESGNKSPSRI